MEQLNLSHQKEKRDKAEAQDRYRADRNKSSPESGAEFLLSIAGMFASAPSNTSENVETIVSDFIMKKSGKTNGDQSN